MDNKTSKNIGSAIRFIIIARDFVAGLVVSFAFLVFGIVFYFAGDDGNNLGALIGLSTIALVLFGLTIFQLYRRLSQRKNESSNLAYTSTDGNIAVNKPSALHSSGYQNELVNETVKAWIGPLFSNQNIHIVGIAVDKSPNTENTLIVTEKFLVGLTIGPSEDSTSAATQVLNMLPVSNTEKLAFGSIFDNQAIKQNTSQQVSTKSVSELLATYSGFATPLHEIADVDLGSNSIKITFKDSSNRSWTYLKQDGEIQTFFQTVKNSLPQQ